MTAQNVADAFVAAINAGNLGDLANLMTPDHVFVDADGSELHGQVLVSASWREYFALVPDFRIEVHDRFRSRNRVVLLGRASGTFIQAGLLKADNHWSVPAAWQVVVASERVAVWRLYVNQQPMHEILARIRTA